MKALICDNCHDLFGLADAERSCKCGQSAGYYMGLTEDRHKVTVRGPCRVLAIPNRIWYGLGAVGEVQVVEDSVIRADGALGEALRRAVPEDARD